MIIYCVSPGQAASTAFWNLVWNILELTNQRYEKYYLVGAKVASANKKYKITATELYEKANENNNTIYVIKSHEKFNDIILNEDDIVFMSVRNLYQAMESGTKKDKSIEPKKLLERYIKFYQQWKDDSDYIIQFDKFIHDKKQIVKDVSRFLKISLTESQIEKLVEDNDNIPFSYAETLLTQRHIQSNKTYTHNIDKLSKKIIECVKEKESDDSLSELFQ